MKSQQTAVAIVLLDRYNRFHQIGDDVIQFSIGSFLTPAHCCIVSRVSKQFNALFNMRENHSFQRSKDQDAEYWNQHFAMFCQSHMHRKESSFKVDHQTCIIFNDKEARAMLAYFLIFAIQHPSTCPFNGYNFTLSFVCPEGSHENDEEAKIDYTPMVKLVLHILQYSGQKRSVQTIRCYNVMMDDSNVLGMIDCLSARKEASNIRSLNFSHNRNITGKFLPKLMDCLGRKCPKLELLLIEGNAISNTNVCRYIYDEFYPRYHQTSRLRRIYLTTNENVVCDPPAIYNDSESELCGMLELRSYISPLFGYGTGYYIQRLCDWDMATFQWDSDAYQ